MSEYEIDTFEENGFTVTIGYDLTAESPHDWEMRGCDLTMWGRNWNFPNDAHISMDDFKGWGDVADWLLNPFAVVDCDNYDSSSPLKRFKTEDEASAYIDTLPDRETGRYGIDADESREVALLVLPVWVYDHSGISLTAGVRSYPYDDRWDSAQAGVAYVTPRIWAYLSKDPWTGSDDQVEQATREITSHVERYGQYCNGEVYSFVIEDFDGEYIDSGSEFYDYDECEKEARHIAQTTEHEPKCTGTLERPSGLIIHDRECPVHTEPGAGYALAPVE